MKVSVSIIIVNYNTKELTKNCIDSIFKYTTDINFEVILVDNDSFDGSVELFSVDNRIRFIRSGGNLGFGKANNIGYLHSIGKYIFLLNSDTILLNNAVKIFYNKMEKLPVYVSCIGTILKGQDMDEIHSYGAFPTPTKELLFRTIGPILKLFRIKLWLYDNPNIRKNNDFEVDYITGADLFIRKEVIEKCGFFDPDFFLYYEETELQYRFKKNGYKNMIVYGPEIIHLFGGSNKEKKTNSLKRRIMSLKSCFLYLKKTCKAYQYIIFRILLIFMSSPILLHLRFPLKERLEYMKFLMKKI